MPRHQLMLDCILANGHTLVVGCEGNNRIGMDTTIVRHYCTVYCHTHTTPAKNVFYFFMTLNLQFAFINFLLSHELAAEFFMRPKVLILFPFLYCCECSSLD